MGNIRLGIRKSARRVDRSRLHPEKRQGKDGVIRTYWVSNGELDVNSGRAKANVRQTYTSAGTSLKNNYPSVFKDKRFISALKEGGENFDIGAGRTDIPTQMLKRDHGVENVIFDPFNRDKEVNRKAVESIKAGRQYPTVTIANVLNVIDNPDSRSNVILQAAKALAPNGKAFFQVHDARHGNGRATGVDTYQTSMKSVEYVKEIGQWFEEVERHGDVIIASRPKSFISETKAEWWLADPMKGGEIILKSVKNGVDAIKHFFVLKKSNGTIKKRLLTEDHLRGLARNEKLEYFRKKIMDHLEKLEKEEGKVKKALSDADALVKGGYSVGTIRVWAGKKYVKVAPGDWRPKYDSESRGAKMAISAIKRKIAAAKDAHEMLQIALANRERFSDKEGHPLPIVKELHDYTEEQKTVKEKAQSDHAPVKPKSPESGGKSSDFDKIREKYQSAKVETGDEDEIQAGKELLSGIWKMVEADTPTASHDETTFHKTPGFPTNEDGSTINDRDYGHDKSTQEAVMSIGSEFDGRALKVDNPVIVTKDGIVISGNNRTMSSKIAARKGTDKSYIEALKRRAKKFGFTVEQVEQFKNPRVVFEIESKGGYSTEQFAKFNQSTKKEMGPTEKAVKVSKLIKAETVEAIAGKISEFDTLGELYANRGAVQSIFGYFKDAGLIGENETGKYIEEGSITDDGKTFIETALLGSVMNEANIRGFNRPGCKSIRATLVRAITPLIENKGMDGYSISRELNEAVDIAMQVAINRDKFRTVDEFSKQRSMFESLNPVAVELAKRLEGTQKAFAEFMQTMNGGLKYAANGEADIFLGGVESKDDILSRFLNIKKAVAAVLKSIPLPHLIKSLVNLGEDETA